MQELYPFQEIFRYSDKNQNIYSIENGILYYTPVRKDNSSSGLYEGGPSIQKRLAISDLNKLLYIIKELTPSEGIQRKMGSSILRFGEHQYLLSYNSASQLQLEDLLHGLKIKPHTQSTHEDFKKEVHPSKIHLLLDGVRDKLNLSSAFRLSDAFGIDKLIIHNSGAIEIDHQIVKKSRHTVKSVRYEFLEDLDGSL